MYIVITKKGFLTGKKKEEILDTDEIVQETEDSNWINLIHGKRKKHENTNNDNINSINNNRILTATTTEDN